MSGSVACTLLQVSIPGRMTRKTTAWFGWHMDAVEAPPIGVAEVFSRIRQAFPEHGPCMPSAEQHHKRI